MIRTVPLWMSLALLIVAPRAGAGQQGQDRVRQRLLDTYAAIDMQSALTSVHAGNGSAAETFLTQEGARRPRPELDALADSLVAIATSYDARDPLQGREARLAASIALKSSGDPRGLAERSQRMAEWQLPPPIAYPLALDKLLLVFEGMPQPSERSAMLGLLTSLPDTGRVVAFLGDVAARRDDGSAARAAVGELYRNMGAAGLATLRRLFEADAVTDRAARRHLRAIATGRGWGGVIPSLTLGCSSLSVAEHFADERYGV